MRQHRTPVGIVIVRPIFILALEHRFGNRTVTALVRAARELGQRRTRFHRAQPAVTNQREGRLRRQDIYIHLGEIFDTVLLQRRNSVKQFRILLFKIILKRKRRSVSRPNVNLVSFIRSHKSQEIDGNFFTRRIRRNISVVSRSDRIYNVARRDYRRKIFVGHTPGSPSVRCRRLLPLRIK